MGSGFNASQLLKGGLDLAVLAVLTDGEDYGYGIARRIWAAGLGDVREASVYGTLNRLFRAGLLRTRMEPSAAGPQVLRAQPRRTDLPRRRPAGLDTDDQRHQRPARQRKPGSAMTNRLDHLSPPAQAFLDTVRACLRDLTTSDRADLIEQVEQRLYDLDSSGEPDAIKTCLGDPPTSPRTSEPQRASHLQQQRPPPRPRAWTPCAPWRATERSAQS